MEQNEVKKAHGGARKGAGRKKTTTASIALRIPADVAKILSRVENRSAFIVEAIRRYAAEGSAGRCNDADAVDS